MDSWLVVKKENESDEQCVGSIQRDLVLLSGIVGKAITIKVQGQNQQEWYYRIGMKNILKFLMVDYCDREGFGLGTIRFIGPYGTRLKATHTPLELEMEDGDVIDAFTEQISG